MPKNEMVEELKAQLEDHDNIVVKVLDEDGTEFVANINDVSYDPDKDVIVIEVQ